VKDGLPTYRDFLFFLATIALSSFVLGLLVSEAMR
jgi:hypothetical protein